MDGGYNNNPYGSQSGGGGGFMPGETNSPSGGKSADRDNKTLRPVTIKQILDATQPYPDAPYQIDHADVANVLFVSQIRNISHQSTNHTYKMDDGTGEIEVRKWVEANQDSMDMDEGKTESKDELTTSGYARVFGAIKSFGNKRYIGAHSVRPVKDLNEILCHPLEATAVHLFFTRGPPGGVSAGGDAGAYGAAGDDANAGSNAVLNKLTPVAQRVYQMLKTEPQDDTGLHLHQLASKLHLPVTDVARAGQELLDAGLIFSTMDEQTWAILEY
ncbi:hypothetical protein N7495_006527 [Penicillium taxi]|uniref:uncharacterized protein n=1 Tax=Penicillium taxi TaxID=168475 RepID=UPI002545468F|nr:uncharacterized protein N7495_006527 [Penicillium taxi]KAJ5894836.1 hypothetical protein N7495_006527 [Penicillium taxi]